MPMVAPLLGSFRPKNRMRKKEAAVTAGMSQMFSSTLSAQPFIRSTWVRSMSARLR